MKSLDKGRRVAKKRKQIKRRVEVDKTRDDAMENSSDTSMLSQHSITNDNNNIVSSPSPCQDHDKEDERFQHIFAKKQFWKIEETSSRKVKDNNSYGPEKYQNNVAHLQRMGNPYSSSGFTKFLQIKKLWQEKWLLYSPYGKAYYCFVCFLFSKD